MGHDEGWKTVPSVRVRQAACFTIVAAGAIAGTWCRAEDAEGTPLDLRLVEEARRGLVQLDMSLRPKRPTPGSGPALPDLTPQDLELSIDGKQIDLRYVDRLCGSTAESSSRPGSSAKDAPADSERALTSRATYVFYLEHTLLTQAGQNHSLEMVEELIRALVRDGDRGIVVSSGQNLLQSEASGDAEELLRFVDTVRKSPTQWAEYAWAESELGRMADVADGSTESQREGRARVYARQDVQLTRNRLLRLAGTLGALAREDPPKVVLYFADTMRKNAGQQYHDVAGPLSGALFDAAAAFDRTLESAAAVGVRLYTIQPEGLTSAGSLEARLERKVGANVVWRRQRYAKDTLSTMALETGGAMFGGAGASLERIRERLAGDLDCMYLLSFEPGDLTLDTTLPVRVQFSDTSNARALREDYEPALRGQVVVASEARRREAEILAAHLAERASDTVPTRAGVVPLGFRDGHFVGLVQIAVANPDLPEQAMRAVGWDLGLSAIVKGSVKRQLAGRIAVPTPRAIVVLESEWSFRPGTTEIVGVASETGIGSVASVSFEVEWPNPDRSPVSVTPIAIVQPVTGGFLRKSEDGTESSRSEGTLIGGSRVLAHRGTEMFSLVCTGKRRSARDLWVSRRLAGPSSGEFEAIHWQPEDGERCVQIHDQVPAAGVLPGSYRYEVSVRGSADTTSAPLSEGLAEFEAFGPSGSANE